MHILVTRPRGKGESLVALLQDVAESVCYQPMIDIVPGPDLANLPALIKKQPVDMLIFVSGFAVDYFLSRIDEIADMTTPNLGQAQIIAVGATTAKKLQPWTSQNILTPPLETSEGLLKLPQLQSGQVKGKNIVIIRGVGGRELLAEQLQSRGAKTVYWQLYQRLEPSGENGQAQEWFEQFQAQQINCIVITSISIFDTIWTNLTKNLPENQATTVLPWLRQIKWVVASDRIGQHAKQSGIPPAQIFNANGANDSAILAQIKRMMANE